MASIPVESPSPTSQEQLNDALIRHLLSLPNELLTSIASFCRQTDLLALARCCQSTRDPALSALYRHVAIANQHVLYRLARVHYKFKRNCLEQIRSCEAHLLRPWDFSASGKAPIDLVGHMPNLRHLSIQYDFDIEDRKNYVGQPPFPAILGLNLTPCLSCSESL